jgi:hypothetical protein
MLLVSADVRRLITLDRLNNDGGNFRMISSRIGQHRLGTRPVEIKFIIIVIIIIITANGFLPGGSVTAIRHNIHILQLQLRNFSPLANYTDRATADCRRS